MMISPLLFFAVLLAGTIAAWIWQWAVRRVQQQKLIGLARDWRMHYAADDRFDLAPRVAERLALPGSAGVRVVDLIYGTEAGVRRYVFSARYTLGVTHSKRRVACVASINEDCRDPISEWSAMKIAPTDVGMIDQYRAVRESKPSL